MGDGWHDISISNNVVRLVQFSTREGCLEAKWRRTRLSFGCLRTRSRPADVFAGANGQVGAGTDEATGCRDGDGSRRWVRGRIVSSNRCGEESVRRAGLQSHWVRLAPLIVRGPQLAMYGGRARELKSVEPFSGQCYGKEPRALQDGRLEPVSSKPDACRPVHRLLQCLPRRACSGI